MPKREKEKKVALNTVISTNLVNGERAIEVYAIDYVEAGVIPDLIVLLRINNEQRCIHLRDAVKEAQASAQISKGQLAAPLPHILPLSQQLVQVGDPACRDTLLNDCKANFIDVYALPGGAAGGDANTGRRSSREGEKKPKGAAAAAGTRGKGQAAGLGCHSAPPEGARCIGGVLLSFIPLLNSTSMDVTIPLSAHSSVAADLRFRVCCRDAPLLTPAEVLQHRPVVLRVGGVEGLPSMPTVSGSASNEEATMNTVASSRILRARVQLGNACVVTPALSVVTPPTANTTTSSMNASATSAPPHRPSLKTHVLPSSAKADVPLLYHEHVLFLSMMGSPLEVYRRLYSTPCKVSLWQSFNMSASAGSVEGANSETMLGSGGFSVRDFLSDDQLRFSESVQLLPDRSTVSLAGGQTCLTTESTIEVMLDFFHSFPPLQHVDQTGAVLNRKAFLTHALIRLPYQAPWMVNCLELLLQEITSFPHATEDVQMYIPPPPSPSAGSQDALEKASTAGRTGGNVGPKTSTVGVSPRPNNNTNKGKGSSKPGTGAAAKSSNRAGVPPPPEPVPPIPAHRFDAPLQLVSPPGLSGFEVTDGKERVWCVEGTVPEVHHVLTRLTAFLESHRYAHVAAAMLFNAELFVPSRAYISFPALVTPPEELSPAKTSAASATTAAAAVRPSPATGAVALEVEPSGTGGRFHRIRLRTTLEALRQTQAHYVHHILSDECLECLNCLSALLRAASMREVELRGWLPSAKLLISLERSFGQTLEREDLHGATPLPSPTHATTPTTLTGQLTDVLEAPLPLSRSTVMDGVPVGTLVSFSGAIRTGGGPRRPIPAAVRQRFPVVAWMVVTGTGEEILCAFVHGSPTGLVQYHVEGQVVQAAGVTLLYVLKCVCLARSFTHSHNAEYEQLLRERQRAQQMHFVRKKVLWPASAGSSDAFPESDGQPTHRNLQRSQRTGKASPATLSGGCAQELSEQSSDDEAEGDVWLASDFYDHLDSSPRSHGAPAFPATTVKNRREGQPGRHDAKERLYTRGMAAAPKTITDAELWRMYEERAPAAKATVTASGATESGEKLPPLRR
ncbi:hypothetical protein ABL78_6099 [Leptomonas seymouri]|uniref:Uncharacterized protein n=1 Tax=Leptomonas seymouri TaxID=5684 RepID=A0A0N1IJ69_LEPSE|nr:hypothetical protein ABL78_6099 [Leptomonas seymouri]|eukprot:KPI84842.1 hypothetical protein ABL78_6099 [Leptomonas seymouri]